MLLPELPDYLTSLGGEDYKGLIISLFTLTAGLSRPFSGRLADKVGRIPVMAFGSLVCVVAGFMYPILTTITPFLLLRLAHGFSTGFKPTGTAAYIADIVPVFRRGEAMGYHGLISNLGTAFGPAIGSLIAQHFSMNTLFYTSSAFAFLSIAILVNMKETLPPENKERLSPKIFKLSKKDIFDLSVLPVAVVVFFTAFSYGTVATLTPDLSKSIGLENKGLFFTFFTLASLIIRILSGKWSDKNGRVPVLKVGSVALFLSLIVVAFTTNLWIFIIGACLYGIAMGIISPITQAWTIDLADDENRGRGIATMYISLEAGIGIGALLPAWIYDNQYSRLPFAFLSSALFAVVAVIYLIFFERKNMGKN